MDALTDAQEAMDRVGREYLIDHMDLGELLKVAQVKALLAIAEEIRRNGRGNVERLLNNM